MVAAGLQDLQIKAADGETYDVFAVVNASGEPNVTKIEINGDDTKIATFNTGQFEALTITANGVSFEAFSALTGNTLNSSPNNVGIPMGTDSQQNPPFVQLIARSIAKLENGVTGYAKMTWYKAQIDTIRIVQAGEQGMTVEMTGSALKTSVDIEGNNLVGVARTSFFEFDTSPT